MSEQQGPLEPEDVGAKFHALVDGLCEVLADARAENTRRRAEIKARFDALVAEAAQLKEEHQAHFSGDALALIEEALRQMRLISGLIARELRTADTTPPPRG